MEYYEIFVVVVAHSRKSDEKKYRIFLFICAVSNSTKQKIRKLERTKPTTTAAYFTFRFYVDELGFAVNATNSSSKKNEI